MPSNARALEFTQEFKRNLRLLARKYRHIRSDIEPLLRALQVGDTPGAQVKGTHYAIFKVRLKNSDARKGKRGGYRVIYFLPTSQRVVLITVYSKSDQADISPQRIRQIVAELEE
jgi:mRNA-degrading endonuclease RelE of RelBE toxin-antitoxin system